MKKKIGAFVPPPPPPPPPPNIEGLKFAGAILDAPWALISNCIDQRFYIPLQQNSGGKY